MGLFLLVFCSMLDTGASPGCLGAWFEDWLVQAGLGLCVFDMLVDDGSLQGRSEALLQREKVMMLLMEVISMFWISSLRWQIIGQRMHAACFLIDVRFQTLKQTRRCPCRWNLESLSAPQLKLDLNTMLSHQWAIPILLQNYARVLSDRSGSASLGRSIKSKSHTTALRTTIYIPAIRRPWFNSCSGIGGIGVGADIALWR